MLTTATEATQPSRWGQAGRSSIASQPDPEDAQRGRDHALPERGAATLGHERARLDPRLFQLAFLGSFLLLGLTALGLDLHPWQPVVVLAVACAAQLAWESLLRLPHQGLRSACISGLGLTLLLRTDEPQWLVVAPLLAISSKFLLRWRGKHLFNPTNFGLCAVLLLTPHAWSSPSQWGEGNVFLAWIFLLGLTVVYRAWRSDVSLAFLASWVLLKLGRVLYLGQRPAVLLHQLSVGSLILFTFFMISDPKTTPNHRIARIAFGATVALLAFYLQHGLWIQSSPIWALLLLSPTVPLWDGWLAGASYRWPSERTTPCSTIGSASPLSVAS